MVRKLNFGAGADLKNGWENIDKKDFDFNEFPYPYLDNTFDYIFIRMVLEHLDKPERVLQELHRIAKPWTVIEILVPHYSNKGAYDDMEHMHYFSEKAFQYLSDRNPTMFQVLHLELIPTPIGKWIPKYCREKLSLFIGGMIGKIECRLLVLKKYKGVQDDN